MNALMSQLPAALPSLTEREARFSEHYAVFDCPADAYLASGEVAPTTKRSSVLRAAYAILARPHVRDRIVELRNAIAANGPQATRAALVRELQEAADVDVREIVNVTRHHCPQCYSSPAYGDWWPMAAAKAIDSGSADMPPAPLPEGHFDHARDPWTDCAGCRGAGVTVTHYTPWDQLSPAARRCLRGVECYGDGALKKVLIADGSQIREQLHRTVPGFYAPTSSVSLNLNANIPPLRRDMTLDEVVAAFEAVSPTEALPAPDNSTLVIDP
jgi:hypothetical protein